MSRNKMHKKLVGEKSKEADIWIYENYRKLTQCEMAEKLGLSASAVNSRLRRILKEKGESMPKRLNKEESELAYDYIRENMEHMSAQEMARALGIKTGEVTYRMGVIKRGIDKRGRRRTPVKNYAPREYTHTTMVCVSSTFVRGIPKGMSEADIIEELARDLQRPREQIAEILAEALKKGVYKVVENHIKNSQAEMCRGNAEVGRLVTRAYTG